MKHQAEQFWQAINFRSPRQQQSGKLVLSKNPFSDYQNRDFRKKLLLAIRLTPNTCLRPPSTQISSRESQRKVTWKQARTKSAIWNRGAREAVKMESRNRPQIKQNPIPDPRVLLPAAAVPHGTTKLPKWSCGCHSRGTRPPKWHVRAIAGSQNRAQRYIDTSKADIQNMRKL